MNAVNSFFSLLLNFEDLYTQFSFSCRDEWLADINTSNLHVMVANDATL